MKILGKMFVTAVLLVIPGLAMAQSKKNAPPAKPSAPPAQHSAPPAQHNAPPAQHNASGGQHNASGGQHNAPASQHNAPAQPPSGNKSQQQTHGGAGSNTGQKNAGQKNAGSNTSRGGNTNQKNTGAAGGNNTRGGNAHGTTGAAGGNNTRGGNAHGANANTTRGANGSAGAGGAHGANVHATNPNSAHGATNTHGAAPRSGPPVTTHQVHTKSGQNVQVSSRGGHVRTIQTKNMTINHGLHGERHVVMERNGRRIVAMGPRGGYAQRAYFNRGGRAYVQRTYYYGGRRYAYAYRTYYYGGSPYYGYAPAYYYNPGYYGWAYNPWPGPAYYNWGYQGQPWYGYYGNYYQPYPSYPSASSWLSDYSLGQTLQAAYEAGQNSQMLAPGGSGAFVAAGFARSYPLLADMMPPALYLAGYPQKGSTQAQMSPEVKQAVTDEIKQLIADEQSAAANSNASAAGGDQTLPALDPKHHIFIVFTSVDATNNDGGDCELNAGDVLYRTEDAAGDDKKVGVTVKSAQKDDCPVGTKTAVDINDLQEMQNHLREQLDAGLKELAAKQGKNGLPAAPDTKTTAGEVPPPAADSNVDNDLQQAQKDADQTEADVKQADSSGQGGNN